MVLTLTPTLTWLARKVAATRTQSSKKGLGFRVRV